VIVLLYLLIATLGSTATVLLVKDVRAKRAVRALAAPAQDRSLDQAAPKPIEPRGPGGTVCKHLERPVAATTTDIVAGPTVVGWLCPTCLADRPEPKPMTCAPMPPGYDGKWHEGHTTPGFISATRITAGAITCERITMSASGRDVIEPGWEWVTVRRGTRDVPLSDNPADWDRADADAAVHALRRYLGSGDYEVSYQAATRMETARARQRELDATPESDLAHLKDALRDQHATIDGILNATKVADGTVELTEADCRKVSEAQRTAQHIRDLIGYTESNLARAAGLPALGAGATSITYANHQAEQHERNVFALALEERLIASGVMAPVTDFVTLSGDPHRGALGRGWPADSPYAPI
jgi:hypothetical protein